jgi:hypothetical protein
VPMCRTELADRNGALAHESADRAAGASSLTQIGSLRTPFDNLLLTALSCGRTFPDSAVKFAPYRCGCGPRARGMTWTRRSPTGGRRIERERHFVPL